MRTSQDDWSEPSAAARGQRDTGPRCGSGHGLLTKLRGSGEEASDKGGGVGDPEPQGFAGAEPSWGLFPYTDSIETSTDNLTQSEDIAMTSAVLLLALSASGFGGHADYPSAQAPSKVAPAPQAPSKVMPAPEPAPCPAPVQFCTPGVPVLRSR